jgi:mRNA interferase MazF
MRRGEIWWAELQEPIGSEPGYRRPVLIVQANSFNVVNLQTVIVAILTTNLKLADAPGNVMMPADQTKLTKDSVLNVTQMLAVDRTALVKRVGALSPQLMEKVNDGLRLVLAL